MTKERDVGADGGLGTPDAGSAAAAGPSSPSGALASMAGGSRPGGSMPKAGVWAWTFVGVIAALVIIVTAVAAVNEIMLPLTFAAVLAVLFKPVAVGLTRRRVRPTVAAGIVVLGLSR